jgi:hypothetical protein
VCDIETVMHFSKQARSLKTSKAFIWLRLAGRSARPWTLKSQLRKAEP